MLNCILLSTVHRKRRDYQCHCGRQFSRKDHVTRHQRTSKCGLTDNLDHLGQRVRRRRSASQILPPRTEPQQPATPTHQWRDFPPSGSPRSNRRSTPVPNVLRRAGSSAQAAPPSPDVPLRDVISRNCIVDDVNAVQRSIWGRSGLAFNLKSYLTKEQACSPGRTCQKPSDKVEQSGYGLTNDEAFGDNWDDQPPAATLPVSMQAATIRNWSRYQPTAVVELYDTLMVALQ